MASKGQQEFVSLPSFAARLYQNLTRIAAIEQQHKDIAHDLMSKVSHGRLLDIGTGPGRLLLEIQRLRPDIELYGLDISEAMVRLATETLQGITVDLRQGNIRRTDYPADFFDAATCTGSFYLWDNPEDCLEEVFRILRGGCSAYLFETDPDCDATQVQAALKANLAREGLLRRLMAPRFLMKQLRMAYRTNEISEIVRRTSFAKPDSIERVTLGRLPAWLRITLTKCA